MSKLVVFYHLIEKNYIFKTKYNVKRNKKFTSSKKTLKWYFSKKLYDTKKLQK